MRFTSAFDEEKRTGLSPLFFAAMANRVDLASQLLDLGADLNVRRKGTDYPEFMLGVHNTPVAGGTLLLNIAYQIESPEMLQLLIARGADIRGTFPCTLLDNACLYGRPGNVDTLLAADPTLEDLTSDMLGMQIFYPISYLLFMGQLDTFEHVLREHPTVMRRYLDRGRAGPTNCLSTAAACVVQSGNVELLKRVLSESSVDVNWVGEGSDKAMFSRFIIPVLDLILKCKRGTPSAFMAFFVFAGPRGAAPLHLASYSGNLGAVEVLLEHNADVHSTKHAYRMTPLHLAAMNGHEAVVDALLKAGARTDAKALGGKTPRDWAEQRGHTALAERLLVAEARQKRERK